MCTTCSDGTNGQQQQHQQRPAFRNPFLPYEEDLWVGHLSDSHTLLLNKFNVVPHHVLVVTRQFESQQDPLNSKDLAATQQVGVAAHTPVLPWCYSIALKTSTAVLVQLLQCMRDRALPACKPCTWHKWLCHMSSLVNKAQLGA